MGVLNDCDRRGVCVRERERDGRKKKKKKKLTGEELTCRKRA